MFPETQIDKFLRPHPTALKPLLGINFLVVEDSRLASEAIHILCRKSGARFRHATSVASAWKHLRGYRPHVVIVDIGLPDGSGIDVIRALTRGDGPRPKVIAFSGQAELEPEALAAGADAFLAKPVVSLTAFQAAIMAVLPEDAQINLPRKLHDELAEPSDTLMRQDLENALGIVDSHPVGAARTYASRFLRGISRYTQDRELRQAARALTDGTSDAMQAEQVLHNVVVSRLKGREQDAPRAEASA